MDMQRRVVNSTLSRIYVVNSESKLRWLPVGDGIWIAGHKYVDSEYVLDFIVERKNVDDLRCSIRDNRYRDQKLRLLLFQITQCLILLS
ncbi:crossover junction endonuclease MUS81-like [Juglans microcarpa x Juglans regia]|uniref:crossover junction endonuclease MUS81-like n=1 Tax=Juglans microcarpa x Juglans regia TaxID=2249226 RepID=UPI001B7E39A1|nr:crossover junction endonuclease MUS81-like [Juglans microcarpa x Juglans regia]